MLKSNLIERIAGQLTQIPIQRITEEVNHIIAVMGETLAHNGRIEIRGFGSFSLHYHPPHKARNPKTGKTLVTTPRYRPHFKAGKGLRERVNG